MARASGWVPNQHGAWAMLVVPAVIGTTLLVREHGFSWAVPPLLAGWFVGYFDFHAVSLWLKSRRRARYLRPVLVYGAATAALAAVALALCPHLLWWAPAFALLLGVGLWEAHRRRDRSMLSGSVTVLAACLLVPVLVSVGGSWTARPVLLAWVAATVYFLGTVLVVKTMIRERGSRGWFAASIGYHGAGTLAAAVAGEPLLAGFFALGTARAWLLPHLAGRGRRIRPGQVGVVELVLCALLLVVLL